MLWNVANVRILLIAWYFPPHNDVGALRTSALAHYLASRGHDIRVLSAVRDMPDSSLRMPIKEDWVVRTPWIDVDSWSIRREGRSPRPLKGANVTVSPAQAQALRSSICARN